MEVNANIGAISVKVNGIEIDPPPTVAISIKRCANGGLLEVWQTGKLLESGQPPYVALELTPEALEEVSGLLQRFLLASP